MSLIHSLSPRKAPPPPAGRPVAPEKRVAAFLARLHDDPLEAGAPAAAAVSWPRPFAAQAGGPRIPLPGACPPWLPTALPVPGSAEWLGELLVTSAGCCRVRYTPAGAQHNRSAPASLEAVKSANRHVCPPTVTNRAQHLDRLRDRSHGGWRELVESRRHEYRHRRHQRLPHHPPLHPVLPGERGATSE
jgi:hypothetical protein